MSQNCLDIPCEGRIHHKNWKCPRCGCDKTRLDSEQLTGCVTCEWCGSDYHWCCHFGDYRCGESSIHSQDRIKFLQKIREDKKERQRLHEETVREEQRWNEERREWEKKNSSEYKPWVKRH